MENDNEESMNANKIESVNLCQLPIVITLNRKQESSKTYSTTYMGNIPVEEAEHLRHSDGIKQIYAKRK